MEKQEQELLKAAQIAKNRVEQARIEREQQEKERMEAKDAFLKKGKLNGNRIMLNLTQFEDDSFWDSPPAGKDSNNCPLCFVNVYVYYFSCS